MSARNGPSRNDGGVSARVALAWPPAFARAPADREAALVLMALRGITPRRLLELAQVDRTAGEVLRRIVRRRCGSANDASAARELRPDDIADSLVATGARFVVVGDREYPSQLEHLADPPLGLFVRGRPLGPAPSMVSIVGARNCSELGRELGHELGRSLAATGVAVVSGAARGVDAAAHEGALAAAGSTVAVLGCGIDAAHMSVAGRALLGSVVERGSVASEYPPGVRPDAYRFPARNRIIAALSRALVVVEGADRSGSLITAEHALELGRDVFAVPGAVTNPLSAAPHRLIREGAGLVRGADDLLADLGLADGQQAALVALDLPLAERAAFDAVLGPVVPDRVAAELGIAVSDALSLLLRLEMRGLVRSVGGRFERRHLPADGQQPAGR